MRHHLIAAIPALVAPLCLAQSQILIEACNTIQDAEKRLECLRAATSTAPAAPSKERVIEDSFVGLHGKLEVGISLNGYNAALLDVGRDLAVYARDAGEEKKPGLAKLEEALQVYKDASTLWAESIRFYARRNNALSYGGGLPYELVGLGWMVSKYSLPTGAADMLGFNRGISVDQSRRLLWLKAKDLATEGLGLLKKPVPLAPPQPPKDGSIRS
jgi:hypothetical protein